MQVLLRVSAANKPEKKIKVSRDVLIGRERGSCDMRIASSEVSRKHCQILVSDKAVAVRDLASANGTRVNGERIPPKTNFPVNPGDVIGIGPLLIRVDFRKTNRHSPIVNEPEDEFLSQDEALAALDSPDFDLEESAPEILIENRLIDSGDDYGSGLETVEHPLDDDPELQPANDGFEDSESEDVATEQFSPIDSDTPAAHGEPREMAAQTGSVTPAALESELVVPDADSADLVPVAPQSPPEAAWESPTGDWEAEDELVSVEDLGSVDLPPVKNVAEVEDFDDEVELVEVEDFADEENVEDPGPIDEGFADFLNKLNDP